MIQLNEDEMRLLSPDPLSLAAEAIGAGTSLLIVTLAAKGAAYVAAPGFDGWAGRRTGVRRLAGVADATSVRRSAVTARRRPPHRPCPAPAVDVLDPTGCGDVFGAAAAARLFAGDQVEAAIRHANGLAARNAAFRGAGGLSRHLRGELVLP